MYILHSPLMDWIITLDHPGNLPETFPKLEEKSCVWRAWSLLAG